MQFFGERSLRITLLVNPTTLPEPAEPRPNCVRGPMQNLADDGYVFIPRKVQKDPVVVFRPWILRSFLVTLAALLDEPEMPSALPAYVRHPVWMTPQRFTHRLL